MEFYLYYAELIACYSFLLPLIPGWYFFKSSPLELRLLVMTLTVSCLFKSIGYYTGKAGIHNLLLYFAEYVVEFYLYALVFRALLGTRNTRRLISIMMILFGAYLIFSARQLIGQRTFDSTTPSLLSLSMLLYCVLYFHQQLNNLQVTFIYKTPWFWMVAGLFLFYAGSFLILLTTNYLMYRQNDLIASLWVVLAFFELVKNLLLTVGYLFIKRS